jgi:hypothetical protein
MQTVCRSIRCHITVSQFVSVIPAITYTRDRIGFALRMRKGRGDGGTSVDAALPPSGTAKMLARGG